MSNTMADFQHECVLEVTGIDRRYGIGKYCTIQKAVCEGGKVVWPEHLLDNPSMVCPAVLVYSEEKTTQIEYGYYNLKLYPCGKVKGLKQIATQLRGMDLNCLTMLIFCLHILTVDVKNWQI